ncbi:phosphotransferase [Amycolatopsis magusensis]|uniref:phosphotransferase n=1 Tax=Amycolatopsis magusensis TaxID=882444 RepID=UPI0024A93077|nr:phosphotransferase [Amycolatopsis magusensis]MDI5975943.1 phosphotransferase [Amycolatopsis magusensis]
MPTPQDSTLPGPPALHEVCRVFGANPADARLLHHRSNAVYLLPHDQLVVRLAPDTPLRRRRAQTCVQVTRWLATQPGPIALPPVPGHQPVIAADAVATFWPHQPTTTAPSPSDVAVLLRRLHALPTPPFPVPPYQPLQRLAEALTVDQQRLHPALAQDDHRWIRHRARTVADTFAKTSFPLGQGLIHADAHRGNLIRDAGHGHWLLIDWDGTCLAPRELDLLFGLPDHFHEPEADRRLFLGAYGYDSLDWPEWPLL